MNYLNIFLNNFFIFHTNNNLFNDVVLNIYDLYFELKYKEQSLQVYFDTIKNDTVTLIGYNSNKNQLFVLYNFDMITGYTQCFNKDFCCLSDVYSFMQIDRKNNLFFTKVFLPKTQYSLCSDTHSFHDNCYDINSGIDKLDMAFMPKINIYSATIKENKLYIEYEVFPSEYHEEYIYFTYLNESKQIPVGQGIVCFQEYLPYQYLFYGREYCNNLGRRLYIDNFLSTNKD